VSRSTASLLLLAATGCLVAASALALEPQIVVVIEAPGPPEHPTCREALQLPPPEIATADVPSISSGGEPETPPPPLPDHPAARPAELPVQPQEGPPDVIARVRDVFARGDAGERVRLSFYGASHTSADWWTGQVRRTLQSRWGDLGHGFILPAALYSGYRGQDVNLCRTGGWRSDWAGRRGGRDDGLLGFAGMSVSSDDPEDFGWLETAHSNPHGQRVERFDVFSMAQPGGGTIAVEVDGRPAAAITTDATAVRLQQTRIDVPDGPHRMVLRPVGDGEVRLFGVSMERAGGGALVDTMGIRGRQAKDWLAWDDSLFADGLQALSPDLVVLAYGTNEAADTRYDMSDYATDLAAVLEKLRGALPDVACVLVGPSDRTRRRRGVWSTWARTELVAEVQRQVAPRYGCAFWDWQLATGGPGSMRVWQQLSPAMASRDGIHFVRRSYEWSADRFLTALEGG